MFDIGCGSALKAVAVRHAVVYQHRACVRQAYVQQRQAAFGSQPCKNGCDGNVYKKADLQVRHCIKCCESFAASQQMPSGSYRPISCMGFDILPRQKAETLYNFLIADQSHGHAGSALATHEMSAAINAATAGLFACLSHRVCIVFLPFGYNR